MSIDDESRVYKTAKGWSVFVYIFIPLLIVLFGYLMVIPFVKGGMTQDAAYFFIPFSLIIISFLVIGLLETIFGYVWITKNIIGSHSIFGKRELRYSDVKGFSFERKYIVIVPKTRSNKKIKITNYIENKNELVDWLYENFKDLSELKKEKEKEEILKNSVYGATTKEREIKLRKGKKISKVLDVLGGIIMVWTIFYPKPYQLAIWCSISFVILTTIFLSHYKGLIRVGDEKESGYPNVSFSLLMVPLGLGFRGVIDYNILDYSNIWPSACFIALGFVALIIGVTREFTFKEVKHYFEVVIMITIFFGFGFSSMVLFNCMYDSSDPEVYVSKVLDKHMLIGKYKTYKVELSKWGEQSKKEVTISRDLYDQLLIDDKVYIKMRKGLFEVPWFEIVKQLK